MSCSADENNDSMAMKQLIPDKILGWSAEELKFYDRETIFDYMNGAGEIYRLYDYHKLLVKRFSNIDKFDIKVEIFDMGSSKDAYGIFSHSRQSENIGIGQGSEYNNGLLSFWKCGYYVCVLSGIENDEAKEILFKFAQTIEYNIKGKGILPDIIKYLPEEGLLDNSIRYFHRHESLNCHYYLASANILNLNTETEAVLASYSPDKMFLLIIDYENTDLADKAYESFINNYIPEADNGLAEIQGNKWVKTLQLDHYIIVVFDAGNSVQANKLVAAAAAKIEMQPVI
ncbi:MAG: hypothetical protein J7K40_02570 [candidate division Zixibacteria bacterium]|nr:hypothetical protein [candidate division Zixibacteria bacterium]